MTIEIGASTQFPDLFTDRFDEDCRSRFVRALSVCGNGADVLDRAPQESRKIPWKMQGT
jgi:hypothetical protein